MKHFAVNSQKTERLRVEAEVSEQALREIYLPAFEKAVREGESYSLTGAYNRLMGEHCCESKALLNGILRLMFRLHMIGGEERKAGSYNTPEHRQCVLEAAREAVGRKCGYYICKRG